MSYKSLEEILNDEESINNTADSLGGDYEFGTHTAGKLASSAEHIQNTQAELEKLGFDKFELLSRGRSALVLRAETGQIIRLDATTDKTALERPQIKQVLQNDAGSIIDGPAGGKIHIEVMENAPSLASLIKNGTISRQEAFDLAEKIEIGLNKDGLVPAGEIGNSQKGYRFDNLGLKNDGTPVVIDPDINIFTIDQAKEINENAKTAGFPSFLKDEIDNFEKNQSKDPGFDWKSEEIKIEKNNSANLTKDVANTTKLAQEAEDTLKAARMAKLGKLGVVTSVGVAVGVDHLISNALDKQKELAETYLDKGEISEEAFKEYIEINNDMKSAMRIENAGAQGWTFLATTPILEKEMYERFQEFSNKHNLPPEVHNSLAMSAFKGISTQEKIYDKIYEELDIRAENRPEQLEKLVSLKQEIIALEEKQSRKSLYNTGGPNMDRVMGRDNLDDLIAGKKLEFNNELGERLNSPKFARGLVKSLPDETLKEILKSTAKYSDSDSALIKEIKNRNEDIGNLGYGQNVWMKGGAAIAGAQKDNIERNIDNLIDVSFKSPELKEQAIEYTIDLITRSKSQSPELDLGNIPEIEEQEVSQSLEDLGFSESDLENGSGDVSAFTDTKNTALTQGSQEHNPYAKTVQTMNI